MNEKVKVAIIGTAGRKEDARKMSKYLFNRMVATAQEVMFTQFQLKKPEIVLVSGGSAWADHIAVRLWLESFACPTESDFYAGLKLYLPCQYSSTNDGIYFHDSTGATLNELHGAFTSKIADGFNSRKDLLCAQTLGADFDCSYHGFLNRNFQVAQSDYVVAFTWGDSDKRPKEGGTKHTWVGPQCYYD